MRAKLGFCAWMVAAAVLVAQPLGRAAEPETKDAPAAPKKLNPDLVNLPANTWVKIKPNRNPVGRAYSGVCWGNGLIFYFGGLHNSWPCNDVELYDVGANTWTQATEPEDWRDAPKWTHLTPEQVQIVTNNKFGGPASGTNHPGILSPKGRPLTCHTYGQQVWWPEEQAFHCLYKGLGLWAFDPAKKEWRGINQASEIPAFRDLSHAGLYYDPGLKTIFAVTTSPQDTKGAHVFDREKKTWTLKCKLPAEGYGEVHAAYDSARKLHVVRTTRGGWYELDLAAGAFRPMKGPNEVMKAADKFPQRGYLQEESVAYDPDNKLTLLISKKTGFTKPDNPMCLWAYDAEKGEWAEVKMAGAAPFGSASWGLLVYDTNHTCCLLLNVLGCSDMSGATAQGVFALRVRK